MCFADDALRRVVSERLVTVSDAPLALVNDPPATLPPVYVICKKLPFVFVTTDAEPPVKATPVELATRRDHLMVPPARSGNGPPVNKLQRLVIVVGPARPDK